MNSERAGRSATSAPVEGWTIEDLGDNAGDIWVSIVVRTRGLVPVRADTELQAGDEVVILADPELRDTLTALFLAS